MKTKIVVGNYEYRFTRKGDHKLSSAFVNMERYTSTDQNVSSVLAPTKHINIRGDIKKF